MVDQLFWTEERFASPHPRMINEVTQTKQQCSTINIRLHITNWRLNRVSAEKVAHLLISR
jgi:hypothetical protein